MVWSWVLRVERALEVSDRIKRPAGVGGAVASLSLCSSGDQDRAHVWCSSFLSRSGGVNGRIRAACSCSCDVVGLVQHQAGGGMKERNGWASAGAEKWENLFLVRTSGA